MFGKKKISSFSKVRLVISGMRSKEEYEIIEKGELSEIGYYELSYRDDIPRKLIKSCECPTQDMIAVMNECNIYKWNGFKGANPPEIRDGYMFDFRAWVNSGEIIRAEGSNNYPKQYRRLLDFMRERLFEK